MTHLARQRTCPICKHVIILVNSETPPHLQFDWCLCKDEAKRAEREVSIDKKEAE